MNKEQEELLVHQFYKSATKTYVELKREFANSTDRILSNALLGSNKTEPIIGMKVSDFPKEDGSTVPMFYSGEAIRCRIEGNNFRDNDNFHLTVYGENLLFQLKKDRQNKRLLVIGVVMGTIAALASVISIFKT